LQSLPRAERFRDDCRADPPDFRTISDFRKRHLKALGELFLQVLKLCETAGLVKLGHVALDGTKIKANASKHKAMSYERMKKREAELKAEVAACWRPPRRRMPRGRDFRQRQAW
jgi:Transposase and inactivated derivatives